MGAATKMVQAWYALPCGVHESTSPQRACWRCEQAQTELHDELDAPLNFAAQMARTARARWSLMTLEEHQAWLEDQPAFIRVIFADMQPLIDAFKLNYGAKRKAMWPREVTDAMFTLSRIHAVPLVRIAKLTGLTYSLVCTRVNDSPGREFPYAQAPVPNTYKGY